MAKKLILVNTNPYILKYDNRKAIELAQLSLLKHLADL
jgi:hypothetical protein